MPLVGVDWSQTGVTHLFSAIKVCFVSSVSLFLMQILCAFYILLLMGPKLILDLPRI